MGGALRVCGASASPAFHADAQGRNQRGIGQLADVQDFHTARPR